MENDICVYKVHIILNKSSPTVWGYFSLAGKNKYFQAEEGIDRAQYRSEI